MIPISFLLLYNNIWEEVYENIFNIRCWCSAIKYALMQEDLTILEKSSDTNSYGYPWKLYWNNWKNLWSISRSNQWYGPFYAGIIDPERGYQYTGGALRYIDKLETVEVLKKRCPTNITIGNDA